jgi:hypothetical protein
LNTSLGQNGLVSSNKLINGSQQRGRSSDDNHKSRKDTNLFSGSPLKSSKRTKSTSPGINLSNSQTRCSVCSDSTKIKPASASPTRINMDEYKKVKRERDELQALLDKFERHMADVNCIQAFESLF